MPAPLKQFEVKGTPRRTATTQSYCGVCNADVCSCHRKTIPVACHSGRSIFIERPMFGPRLPGNRPLRGEAVRP